jgi:hypothetical protein
LIVPSVVILVPLASTPRAFIGAMGFLSFVVVIGFAYCFSGYLMHRQRRSAAWFTAILLVLTTALQSFLHLNFEGIDMEPPWLVVNAVVFILLLTNWSRFGVGDGDR